LSRSTRFVQVNERLSETVIVTFAAFADEFGVSSPVSVVTTHTNNDPAGGVKLADVTAAFACQAPAVFGVLTKRAGEDESTARPIT
jgi:hypothetical protein